MDVHLKDGSLSKVLYMLQVGLVVFCDRFHAVPTKFFEKRIRNHQGCHCLPYYRCCGHGTHIRTLVGSLKGFLGDDINRSERLTQCGYWLHPCPDKERHPVGHATLYSSGIVRPPVKTGLVTVIK